MTKEKQTSTYTRFTVTRSSPSLWRVTFDNPPINLIDAVMMKELLNLLTEIERDKRVGVVLFDSADPSFILFAQPQADAWNAITALLRSGAIKPIVAKTFPLAEAADALRHLVEDRPFGRVVLTI